jgi:hypothetical protein
VQTGLHPREDRACLVVGVVADGDDVVEGLAQVAIQERSRVSDSCPEISTPSSAIAVIAASSSGLMEGGGHHRPGAVKLEPISSKVPPQEPLGHLRAGRVVGAQEQDPGLRHHPPLYLW